MLPFGSALADHTLLTSKLEPQTRLRDANLSEMHLEQLLAAVQASEGLISDFSRAAPKGFIWQTASGWAPYWQHRPVQAKLLAAQEEWFQKLSGVACWRGTTFFRAALTLTKTVWLWLHLSI